MTLRKLPIGIQDFPSLRSEGYLYVDKTALMYKLVSEGKVYFLSRPRRFGKSLLCSTLGAYFEGRKDLFSGLAIEKLEQNWKEHPVLRLDLNPEYYTSAESLETILNRHLHSWEEKYGTSLTNDSISGRFLNVIRRAYEKTGRGTVVIIDEYDKPLLATIGNNELQDKYRLILKSFYGVLKSADAWTKFVFLTGVTKFAQVSVFSDLNQLQDISMHPKYATICGITEEELTAVFKPELQTLAEQEGLEPEACLTKVRQMYNGYCFDEKSPSVYNPFSTLNLFSAMKFQDFWFQTGTPTFLVEQLKKYDTDLREIDGIEVSPEEFANYRQDDYKPIPVIFQSGYLTIKGYDPAVNLYKLGFPNNEVRNGFLNFVLPFYLNNPDPRGGFNIAQFTRDLKSGNIEAFMFRLQGFFEGIPYELNDKTERHYQVVFYLVFSLLGQFVQAEHRTARGRADAVVCVDNAVYVFEFKLNGTAEQALEQINSTGYAIPYEAQGRQVIKIGVEFGKEERNITRWLLG